MRRCDRGACVCRWMAPRLLLTLSTICCSTIILGAVVAANAAMVSAPDANIRITGRTNVTGAGVAFDHPGVRITARVQGSQASAKMMRVGPTTDHFVVYVDGKPMPGGKWLTTFNTTSWGQNTAVDVPLFSGLAADATHDVVIFKSTEAMFNSLVPAPNYVTLMGIDTTGTLVAPPAPLTDHKLEFLGDR